MRTCAIDIGSNSVRCLIADIDAQGRIKPVSQALQITRLSEGMDKTGIISAGAAERTVQALEEQLALGHRANAGLFILFGTQAMRSAQNASSFLDRVKQSTGYEIRVLSGEEEADWIHRGVTQALGTIAKKGMIIDIGGGSTEFINKPFLKSVALGCVKLTEHFLQSDPPVIRELEALTAFIQNTLSKSAPGSGPKKITLIGAGGTITTAAAISLRLEKYEPNKIHGHRLGIKEITNMIASLAKLPLVDRKETPGLEEKRADIIIAGLMILRKIMIFYNSREITVSDQGILYGAVTSAVP